ncbi:MAG: hypothetical protein QOI66_2929, partial [Myxococcales bacterium]|nr:hypothetical protein [Myxococcales bacterium]
VLVGGHAPRRGRVRHVRSPGAVGTAGLRPAGNGAIARRKHRRVGQRWRVGAGIGRATRPWFATGSASCAAAGAGGPAAAAAAAAAAAPTVAAVAGGLWAGVTASYAPNRPGKETSKNTNDPERRALLRGHGITPEVRSCSPSRKDDRAQDHHPRNALDLRGWVTARSGKNRIRPPGGHLFQRYFRYLKKDRRWCRSSRGPLVATAEAGTGPAQNTSNNRRRPCAS